VNVIKSLFGANTRQQVWRIAGAVSIRVKVLGIVLGVILLLGGFVVFQMRSVLANELLQNLEEQGIALAANIARDARLVLDDPDPNAMNLLLTERQIHYSSESHNTSVDFLIVQSADGRIIARQGQLPQPPDDHYLEPAHGDMHPVFIVNEGRTVEIHSPIPDTDATLRMGLSIELIEQTVSSVTLQLFAITLVMIAVGFAAAFLLTWVLTQPILELLGATHAVAGGDFTRRVPRWADDEIGQLATAFNQMTESLQQAEQERHERERMREEYITGVIMAQENERQRIARELHDSTSQSLTSLLVGLQNLKHAHQQEIQHQVDELRDVVGQTLEEIRNISWQLRPSVLDDHGLESAVKNFITEFEKRYQIPVETMIRGLESRLPSQIETTVYRIIQEGLTNVARYAQASAASLVITRKNDELKIIIEDNGIGFDPVTVQRETKSLGLRGIRERAVLFGGELTIESQPGQGTSLFIEMHSTQPEEGTLNG
jgi:signal transduction histidine kinase